MIGGGLAGIAAATALARFGKRVTLLEAKSQLGGRATSYTDQTSGEVIDNCQHVSMGCCTNLRHLCECLGIADHFQIEKVLYFVDPQNRITSFTEGMLPAPFHLTGAFLKLPYLSLREKFHFATAIRALAKTTNQQLSNVCFLDWLKLHKQTDNLIRNVWEVVLISALSESLDRIDASYARKVFVDGFLSNRTGWRVEIPEASLDVLYSEKTLAALNQLNIKVLLQARVAHLNVENDKITSVHLRDGNLYAADDFILAVPQHQVHSLIPQQYVDHPVFQKLNQIESAPITSVHLWFDQPITELPHAVLLERMSQWVFNRGSDDAQPPRYRYQIVISASRNLQGMTQSEVINTVRGELSEVWSVAKSATLLHARMITEKRAVFSVTPGINELRPAQQSPIPNLQLAGDWTHTNWPATMEGAVRSGYLAAINVLNRYDLSMNILQQDLPVAFLSRWLLGVK